MGKSEKGLVYLHEFDGKYRKNPLDVAEKTNPLNIMVDG